MHLLLRRYIPPRYAPRKTVKEPDILRESNAFGKPLGAGLLMLHQLYNPSRDMVTRFPLPQPGRRVSAMQDLDQALVSGKGFPHHIRQGDTGRHRAGRVATYNIDTPLQPLQPPLTLFRSPLNRCL